MSIRVMLAASWLALALAGCQDDLARGSTRHLTPIPPATMSLMASKGMAKSDPILVRAYKKESEMEVWKRGPDGKYALLKTYPICRWSGQLGPKTREGDRQAPEGFYTVTPAQMNPNSAYYLSFDTGYPNAFDRAHGRRGANLMVHGTCSSSGCFAMTDAAIAEVYAVAREAFNGGQRAFQFQSYPFRMTPENLAKFRADPNLPFWKNLKEGSDYFEALREEPRVGVCNGRYVFGGADVGQGSCSPEVEPAVAEKSRRDEQQLAELVGQGTPAIKLVYADGGGNPEFHQAMASASGGRESSFPVLDFQSRRLGEVSRPDALATGPREITLDPGKKSGTKPSTALAFAPEGTSPKETKTAAKPGSPEKARTAGPASSEAPKVEVVAAGDSPSLFGRLFGRTESKAEAAPQPIQPPKPSVDPGKKASSADQPQTTARKAEPAASTKAQARMPAETATRPAGSTQGASDRRAEATGALPSPDRQ